MTIDEITRRSLGNELLEEKFVYFRIAIYTIKNRTRRIQSIVTFFIKELLLFQFIIYLFIYLFFIYFYFVLKKSYKNLIFIYIHTDTQTHTYMHAYAYICVYTVYAYARAHICINVYISTPVIRENRTCRRLKVLSSSPENILK